MSRLTPPGKSSFPVSLAAPRCSTVSAMYGLPRKYVSVRKARSVLPIGRLTVRCLKPVDRLPAGSTTAMPLSTAASRSSSSSLEPSSGYPVYGAYSVRMMSAFWSIAHCTEPSVPVGSRPL